MIDINRPTAQEIPNDVITPPLKPLRATSLDCSFSEAYVVASTAGSTTVSTVVSSNVSVTVSTAIITVLSAANVVSTAF